MSGTKKSAPGPDGVRCSAWASNTKAAIVFSSAYVMWLHFGSAPVFFNVAFLWLLPECDPPDGIFNPSDTQALTGANTDATTFAKILASSFSSVIDKWATQA